jgi:hypothetical protein
MLWIILVAALVVLGAPTAAEAGDTVLGIDAECNEATGEYEVTFTILNSSTDDGQISVDAFLVDGADAAQPDFAPNPLPGNGTSEAVANVPGTTTTIFIDLAIQYPNFNLDLSGGEDLAGDCEPPATTTTVETTTTVGSPAQSVRAVPAFTG